ncbi:MAG: RNA polymerase sigma factor [Sarcina sp.]
MTENLIFKKAQKGDADSFNQLLEPIKGKLYRISFMYMKNEVDAMDALSDSIVKAIKGLDKCKSDKTFNSWIATIVVNTCKNNLKKLKRDNIVEISEFENKLTYEDKGLDDDSELYDAINTLNDRERDLILKRYIDDMSVKEISKANNVPEGTVKSGLNRTLKKLRVILGGA